VELGTTEMDNDGVEGEITSGNKGIISILTPTLISE